MPKSKILVKVLFVFIALIIILGLFVAVVFKRHYVAPILMYHYIVETKDKVTDPLLVRPETFARQMEFLQMHHYNVLPLETLAVLIKENRLPPKAVAITFDDGYKDNFTQVFPILIKYNLPATIFLITSEVGKRNRLDWQEIKLMQDSGLVTFASHAVGPDPLIKMKSDEDLKYQIFESKCILEEKLGKKVNLFSYPEGMFNAKIRQLVIDAGYSAAVATGPGKNYLSNDIFALKRLRISEKAGNMFIFWVETSGCYTFMKENKRKHEKK